ncbi:aggregation-promoting factor C-terminal-like domain-containing protein [Ornithinimicrobium ciconiae]|uniref:aggregation-promoting factor C-terminal-like domain-containing protein n=1 Tax=Ornithinimicrobium ciconiae TaxID=2594265 RepID=UPI00192E220A|nr:lytic transglycosylase domain-containing protein [Ornithinimicrobium ciconiae]
MSNAPDLSVLPDSDDTASGKHRNGRRLHRGATAVTAIIAAGAVAMATYAAMPVTTSPTLDGDGVANSISDASPFVGDAALRSVVDGAQSPLADAVGQVDQQLADSQLHFSAWSARKGGDAATERSETIAAERAAAEQAAAEEAAAQRAEEAAAAEAAATEAAAAEREQAASRSEERVEAPVEEAAPAPQPAPEPEPEPEPAPAPPAGDARSIARNMLGSYGWSQDQFGCLDSLWMRESGWNHTATNPSSGAYGIPQSLPASKMASAGSDWRTNPATQIRWGLGYIQGRYGSPCSAWAHSQSVGWY